MKLTGNLKKQVEATTTKDEAREAIRKAGMILDDAELDQVTGGVDIMFAWPGTTTTGDAGEHFCIKCNAIKMFRYCTTDNGEIVMRCKTCGS